MVDPPASTRGGPGVRRFVCPATFAFALLYVPALYD